MTLHTNIKPSFSRTFLISLQLHRSPGPDGSYGRSQRIHLQLWDTAGQERSGLVAIEILRFNSDVLPKITADIRLLPDYKSQCFSPKSDRTSPQNAKFSR
ncbi:hypothetical protein DPMN_037699 [Dreissena polymorpha]|uniref:Uncharacterized protein n=1 Tax=Dreissena polymorpha TaxID=45954 RepID=A0A9D4RQ18_DREPO|nr:hypothetical protein DPMN_037699 [Dreissena polymorpha]